MIERMLGLFGTIANAHRVLGLDGLVPYSSFYRGLHFHSITPQDFDAIMESWQRWQDLYLRPEVPVIDDLHLTVESRDNDPVWRRHKVGVRRRA